jgi:hypothetical protein
MEILSDASLIKVDDGQLLPAHPVRQIADDPQLVPDRRQLVAEGEKPSRKCVEVAAEDAGPQSLRSGRPDEVFQHASPPGPAASRAGETASGLFRVCQVRLRPFAGTDACRGAQVGIIRHSG